ncbi:MAG: hypothetical protein KBA81_07760 [Rhabdochlamydiaceae bacterium]|nr:hypothetical protein [Rhabdochlamydiaceae bacterium]
MTLSTRIILNAFLHECPTEERQRLINCLSPTEKQALSSSPKTFGNPLKSQEDPEKLLSWIHHSWITPFLRTLSEKEIGLFLASLSSEKVSSVGKDLLYAGKIPSLSQLGKLFLRSTLVRYLTAEMDDLLPIECLPESPLNDLIALPTDILINFLDLLGLHDLSVEVKQIIDKQKLSKIDEALTADQLQYLKILLQSHEPVAFSQMGLVHWNGDKEKLKLLVRQRGANRLAKALHGQDSSLQWYVLHRLDVEKALLVQKLSAPIDNPRAAKLLIQQVVELINYTRGSNE